MTASVTETQGLTVLEAMASGLPVVARQDPSFSSMIRDGVDGFLFSSQEELTAALVRLLSDETIARTLVEGAGEKVRAFSAEAFGKGIEAIL